ncbi:hypothetical protein HanXRQr2_Chr03g0102991 [Helianthus annuus]|uniref:Uncharacterized protein n=1 Tax=Helianthus annuus TaxID=4232 RepID=A0A9K3NUI7_HELAN|nr:hypothetical protein HanXRQr2_Chr03g0102991 [Helianthus annuus]KAJ0943056.1 hypothetical protein HanPSC8_Chr03g0099461 [Helianthus annuus]
MGRKKEYNTLSRPAIDEKSKGFPGNPAPGIDGMAGAVPDGVSAELDSRGGVGNTKRDRVWCGPR